MAIGLILCTQPRCYSCNPSCIFFQTLFVIIYYNYKTSLGDALSCKKTLNFPVFWKLTWDNHLGCCCTDLFIYSLLLLTEQLYFFTSAHKILIHLCSWIMILSYFCSNVLTPQTEKTLCNLVFSHHFFCGLLHLLLLQWRANTWDVSYTSNPTGEKHTTSTFVNQTRIQLTRQPRKNRVFFQN